MMTAMTTMVTMTVMTLAMAIHEPPETKTDDRKQRERAASARCSLRQAARRARRKGAGARAT